MAPGSTRRLPVRILDLGRRRLRRNSAQRGWRAQRRTASSAAAAASATAALSTGGLRRGFNCYGIDRDQSAIARIRRLAAALAPALPSGQFEVGELEDLPFDDGVFDAVICSAVLHFADDAAQFGRMLEEMWRVLAPNGLLFARLASNIGIEREVGAAGRRVHLPDGTDRFVVDEAMLHDWSGRLGGRLADPIKTSNVQQQRCMTTWCLTKP